MSRSRNGTVRNTDSFFKDDTAEPKKISLTPNLLRDESNGNTVLAEWKEVGPPPFARSSLIANIFEATWES